MIILLDEYLGKWEAPEEHIGNALILLDKVDQIYELSFADGVDWSVNPVTKSYVSGEKYGGYRPQECSVGAKNSAHKTGQAVDIYDPRNEIDTWCYIHQQQLRQLGLFMEHPTATEKWCHLTTRAPASGKIAFLP